MLPNSVDISPKLRGSKIFSKLDAASGFYQIPLDEESRLVTTFISQDFALKDYLTEYPQLLIIFNVGCLNY